jgi:predicted RNA-binding Zn-ribbon protein involved in translation (DUF1610 family)
MELKLVVEVLFTQEQLEWLVNAFEGLPRTSQHLEAIEEDMEDLQKRMEILRSANVLSDLEGQERVERQIIGDDQNSDPTMEPCPNCGEVEVWQHHDMDKYPSDYYECKACHHAWPEEDDLEAC